MIPSWLNGIRRRDTNYLFTTCGEVAVEKTDYVRQPQKSFVLKQYSIRVAITR